MWFKIFMSDSGWETAVVFLNVAEYEAVTKFLSLVNEQRREQSWVGGDWRISKPCNTKEEAEFLK